VNKYIESSSLQERVRHQKLTSSLRGVKQQSNLFHPKSHRTEQNIENLLRHCEEWNNKAIFFTPKVIEQSKTSKTYFVIARSKTTKQSFASFFKFITVMTKRINLHSDCFANARNDEISLAFHIRNDGEYA
jgi:hypothetical protein